MGGATKSKLGLGLLATAGVVVVAVRYLRQHTIAVLDPKGPIAAQERDLIVTATLIMLIVVIPVFVMTFAFAWKYRDGNTKARYTPEWDHHSGLEFSWWAIPTIIIVILARMTWVSSHTLDPYRPIASVNKTMTIQVVALDWKWLFIYPQQNIATVNYVQFPVNTPVDFQITSDAPMNSFWIPQLGGQIYAMPGMTTQLNLLASSQGSFHGSSANLSGIGFSGMTFTAHASSEAAFNQWVGQTQQSHPALTMNHYNQLAHPSSYNRPASYAAAQPGLFNAIVMKYMVPSSPMPNTPVTSAASGSSSMPGMNMTMSTMEMK
jgi:cytochrome o ubiquinol oxidase subunit 2